MKNILGREIPQSLAGYGELEPYSGVFATEPKGCKMGPKIRRVKPGESKLLPDIETAIRQTGLKDGMTISFHHHLREGDYVLNMVMEAIAKLGIKDLVLSSSSLTTIHAPLIEHIKNGVVSRIESSGIRGPLGEALSAGLMDAPVVIRSHGGRARAIEAGETAIDVTFQAASSADAYGNANGMYGKSLFGSMGYGKLDSRYAHQVVVITDNLVAYPNEPISVPQTNVDYVVAVDSIGDPQGIMAGATRYTSDPRELLIAGLAARVIENSGYFKDGFSFQSGTGGASLAVARFMKGKMIENNIRASFILGGINQQYVEMHKEGLVRVLLDTQTFDLAAAQSLGENRGHQEIDVGYYANPFNCGCAVNMLDMVILSALEVDVNFHVNVMTGFDGIMRGASGGHADTAAGAKLAIVVAPLIRGRIPTVVESVNTIITPGNTVDVLVTDHGVAVNPLRRDLLDNMQAAGLPLCTIQELATKAEKMTGKPQPLSWGEKIVGVVEYRDGTVIDVIRQVL